MDSLIVGICSFPKILWFHPLLINLIQIKMQYDWKKSEKQFYLPKSQPVLVNIPTFSYFLVAGKGNPNDDFFAEYIGVLYSLSYAVKMSPKQGSAPDGYFDFTVYPLEGVWDIAEEAKPNFTGKIDKDALVFQLMIRQPDFVTTDFALEIIERVKKKKPHPLLESVQFVTVHEGLSVQMMHVGRYDDEPQSFSQMESFATSSHLRRISHRHREIYLSDARKVAPEKLKTILRIQVEPI